MDNNLISVDALVRQRLTGGEERERSGAWLRMRELLDKEEDRKPVGFIWRRMFGGLAILILLGAFSLGGYELVSKNHNASMGNGNAIASATGLNPSAGHSNSSAVNNNTEQSVTAAKADNDHQKNTDLKTTPGKNKISGSKNTLIANKRKSTNKTGNTKELTAGKIHSSANNNVPAGQPVASNNVAEPTGSDASANNGIKPVVPADHNKGIAAGKKGSENTEGANKVAGDNQPGNVKVPIDNQANTAAASTASEHGNNKPNKNNNKHNKTIAHPVLAASASGTSIPAGIAEKPESKLPGADEKGTDNSVKQSSHKSNKKDAAIATSTTEDNNKTTKRHLADGVASTKKSDAHKPADKAVKTPATAAATNNTGKLAKKETKKGSNPVGHVAVSSAKPLPVGNAKAIAHEPVLAASAHQPKATGINKLPVNKPAITAKAKGTNQSANLLAANTPALKKGNKPTGIINKPNTTNSTGNTGAAETSNTPKMGNKMVQKITIVQKMLQTGPGTYLMHMDTISIENVNEEFAIIDHNKVFGPPPTVASIEEGSAANNTGDKEVVLAASASLSDQHAEPGLTKAEQTKKKGAASGPGSLENAMNDIKYKISGARFAMGLKGGINGTFFGPNSFKGFQFGVTGSFIFSESVSILSELEYFHRINNDYVFTDNYYSYTQIGPNLWSKQQMSAPYNFSTLQSFELPVMLRYTKGNFNFFGGGNLVYSFAVNEGATLPVAANTPAFTVSSVGNDNVPKIQANDFNARFGLGYIFGVGIQLSPVLSLDVRDVQTFWDNSKTSGSKEVSGQLYKSPSFQLSLGYRFGGKKGKEKE